MFVLIKEVVFVEWFRIRKIPVRIPRNFKLNSENSEKSSTNCSALLWTDPIFSDIFPYHYFGHFGGQSEVSETEPK